MAGQDNWQGYYAPTISRINDRLLEWYEVGESAEREVALDVIRTKMQSQCGKVASSDQDATTCSNFLVRAGPA